MKPLILWLLLLARKHRRQGVTKEEMGGRHGGPDDGQQIWSRSGHQPKVRSSHFLASRSLPHLSNSSTKLYWFKNIVLTLLFFFNLNTVISTFSNFIPKSYMEIRCLCKKYKAYLKSINSALTSPVWVHQSLKWLILKTNAINLSLYYQVHLPLQSREHEKLGNTANGNPEPVLSREVNFRTFTEHLFLQVMVLGVKGTQRIRSYRPWPQRIQNLG